MKFYIACEEVNFIWTRSQVEEFDRLWIEEDITDLTELAKRFGRKPYEISFLVWDRAQHGYIGPEGGKGSRYIAGKVGKNIVCACGKPQHAKGLCNSCYAKKRRETEGEMVEWAK